MSGSYSSGGVAHGIGARTGPAYDRTTPRRFAAPAFGPEVLRSRTSTVAAVLVARDEAATVGDAVAQLRPWWDEGLLDRLVVVDGGSADGTPRIAAAAGAEVIAAADVLAGFGPVLGKGDSIWRATHAVDAEVLAFLDADLQGRYDHYVLGLVAPLLTDPTVRFVKGGFRRTRAGEHAPRHLDGGRVTEMVARPLLNLVRPDLAGFYQPLGGQVAARRADLTAVPVLTGYAVEISMLAGMVDRFGLDAVVESDLGDVVNRERPVEELVPMAQEVLHGLLHGEGGSPRWTPYVRPLPGGGGLSLPHDHQVVVRPPLACLDQAVGSTRSRRSDIGSS